MLHGHVGKEAALHLNFFELVAVLYPEIKEKYQKEFEIIRIMGK